MRTLMRRIAVLATGAHPAGPRRWWGGIAAVITALGVAASSSACAQVPRVIQGGGPPPSLEMAAARADRTLSDPSTPSIRVLTDLAVLRGLSKVSPAAKTRADALLAEASSLMTDSPLGGFRPRVAEAAALLLGREWNDDAAYPASLEMTVTELVADPKRPLHVRLDQLFPAAPPPGLTLSLDLAGLKPPGVTGSAPDETQIKRFWTMPAPSRDLIEGPMMFDVELGGRVADGDYALVMSVMRGDQLLGVVRTRITLAADLDKSAVVRAFLERGGASDDLAATISYPFDTARAVNGWRREIPDNLNLGTRIRRALGLVDAASEGHDPLWRSTGDQYRAYHLAVARETMPYHLYVPASWTPGARFPLVVVLHGGGLNEDSVLPDTGRFAGEMQRLADRHGMIVVSPLGFRPSGGYGAVYGPTSPGRDGVRPDVEADQTIPTLSEADVISVIGRVSAEYEIDPDRLYLVGNSMGGGGTWFLGGKYASMFAAIAPCGSSLPLDKYDFDRLARVPVHVVVGELDAEVRRNLAHQAVSAMRAKGYNASLTVVPGEVHGTAWQVALPDIFDFFDSHRRAR